MPVRKYRPYYKFIPTSSNPLLDELTHEEVDRNLRLLNDDLHNHFEEVEGAGISYEDDGVIVIASDLDEKRCDEIVAICLSGLHLLADKIPK